MRGPVRCFGFTLVELLVTISIMTVLFGVGLARYNQFNQSRRVVEAAKNLRSDLNFARSKALAGDKSGACTGDLDGWYIEFFTHSYDLGRSCGGTASSFKTVSLDTLTLTSTKSTLLFRPLSLGVDTVNEIEIFIIKNTYQEKVTVSRNGEIN
ncbi:MAG: prepilin-type N-terminal cleavage/methylation domain-containing protein [Candidatus Shapirobacteria bacterium]